MASSCNNTKTDSKHTFRPIGPTNHFTIQWPLLVPSLFKRVANARCVCYRNLRFSSDYFPFTDIHTHAMESISRTFGNEEQISAYRLNTV